MSNYKESPETELGFKYHTQEFVDASQELRQVGHIGRLAKTNVGMVQDFFDALEYLDEIYSEYFSKKDEIKKILDNIEEKLKDKKYLTDIESYNNGKTSLKQSLNNYESKLIKKLKEAFKIMSADLVKSQLRPRPNKINTDEFPDVEDKVLKEILKGANSIIKK